MEPGSESDGGATDGPKREPSGLIDKINTLIGEIAATGYLSLASVWRVARAMVARDSVARIAALSERGEVLPPTLALFVGGLISALTLATLLQARFPGQGADTVIDYLSDTSAETWLLVAAPAFFSLWIAVFLSSRMLHAVGGRHSADPTPLLTYVTFAIVMLSCVGIATAVVIEWLLPRLYRLPVLDMGAPDALVILGFWLLIAMLVLAGWRYGQQAFASSASRWRQILVYALAPIFFVGAIAVALVLHYEIFLWQARGEDLRNWHGVSAKGQTCFVTADSLMCELLLRSGQDLAVGPLNFVTITVSNRDAEQATNTRTASHSLKLSSDAGQVEQLSPRVRIGSFWELKSRNLTPVAFRITAEGACHLREIVGEAGASFLDLRLTSRWYPGFILFKKGGTEVSLEVTSEDVYVPDFGHTVSKLCEKLPAESHSPSAVER